MRRYVAARLAQSALVVLLSLSAVFGMVRLGGDPVLLFLPMDIQAKDVNEFRQRLGFNDPLLVQYGRFVAGAVRGDFGESLRYKRDALGLVLERLPATLALAATALGVTFCLAVPIGVVSAIRRAIGTDNVVERGPAMASEDFGYLGLENHQIPTMMFSLGAIDRERIAASHNPGAAPLPSLHSGLFYPAPEPTLRTGVTAMSAALLDLLKK